MYFAKQISLMSLALAFAAASPAAQPNPKVLQAREQNKDRFINPSDPKLSLDEQCTWIEKVPTHYHYNVVINDATDFTDDQCGSGFLDNLHGRGCAVTGWDCNYADDDKTMNAGFNTDTACEDDDVSKAINAAFGEKKVRCANYEFDIKCGDDGKCDVDKPRDNIWDE
ncbi:hypothetical protein P168DRAFT_316671 [Aspergillus campestris IBT 28561]|uniref:Ecp2 effector protein domain-containing protein n=1 Tax=Aspergillus campestris (strain IBT 28561) TaxID=1392248 RepID=A0A2I1D9X6_ASPC2|nr:uncharacterized protein P168DRAFT_316671 [Aspergillus campestris IBT 28561]PKY06684.1 hypothetical protein P168DRAFT_316671 [Aspergillus campestris IBT 28561]